MKNEEICPALKALNELAEEAHANGNSWPGVIEPRVELIQAAMIAAAPVPPAGGEVEVPRYASEIYFNSGNAYVRYEKSERGSLVFHGDYTARVTRLQAACAGNFKQAQENGIERDKVNAHRAEVMAERDALKDELESVREVLEATRVARDAAQYLLSEKITDRDNERLNSLALQSALTKARELLTLFRRALNGGGDQLSAMEHGKAFRDVTAFLAHQSAPAAKACQQPQAHPARCGCEQVKP